MNLGFNFPASEKTRFFRHFLSIHYSSGRGWVRFFRRFVITFKDLRRHQLDFSQRLGLKKYITFFGWCFSAEIMLN